MVAAADPGADEPQGSSRAKKPRRSVLLRMDPVVHEAMAKWADDEFRSLNAQIEVTLREALFRAGRLSSRTGPVPKRGRPPKVVDPDQPEECEG